MAKLRKSKVSREEIARLYTEGLLTMEEIGHLAGISKQSVMNALNNLGIDYRGGKVERTCHYCKQPFMVQRKKVKRGTGNYCSITCFHAERITNPDMYLLISEADRRNGNRVARKIMGMKEGSGRVVHHKDGNPTNNSLDNLQVIKNASAHMRLHHSNRGE